MSNVRERDWRDSASFCLAIMSSLLLAISIVGFCLNTPFDGHVLWPKFVAEELEPVSLLVLGCGAVLSVTSEQSNRSKINTLAILAAFVSFVLFCSTV
jgi:hypothetical protein